jgi:beta-lactamase regulating signal transducer with metallopeptidase domain
MMLPFLLDSALRSCLLGGLVWVMLKLTRLCDTRTETAIWTAVLIAALSMPILSRYMPALVLNLPRLPDTPSGSATALHTLAAHQSFSADDGQPSGLAAWLSRNGETCLLAVYALGLLVFLTRIVTGLLLTMRMYRRAVPVGAAWAKGRNIRVSRELKSPVSLAGAILLTADHEHWSLPKRNAVLAHEEAHLARGDFYIQLAALIHCAFFWFSPFAWWLQRKLAQIAETASDEAAIRRLEDPVTYAEILIEVSRCAQKTPLIVGMATGPFIQQRLEHILSETPRHSLGLPLRLLMVAALAVLALAVAGARAAVSPVVVAAQAPVVPAGANSPLPTSSGPTSFGKRVSTVAAVGRRARQIHEAGDGTRKTDSDVTYNPRALLDPEYSPKSDYVSPSTVVHAGKTFYIRSNERPVAEVAPVARAYHIH